MLTTALRSSISNLEHNSFIKETPLPVYTSEALISIKNLLIFRYSIIFLPGDFFEIEEAIYDQARWEEFSRLKL